MTLAILVTGAPPQALIAEHGDYADMMQAMVGPDLPARRFDVRRGELPPEASALRGVIVTGSAAGVYEDYDWIPPLMDWLNQARGRTRLVGICFGHQVMAKAFGGEVRKADQGWGLGLHTYRMTAQPAWAQPIFDQVSVACSHQDQVVVAPPGATRIATSDFCPLAGLVYGEEAISLQFHPEFTPAFAAALYEGRRQRLGDAATDAAISSLGEGGDRQLVGGWIRRFLMQD